LATETLLCSITDYVRTAEAAEAVKGFWRRTAFWQQDKVTEVVEIELRGAGGYHLYFLLTTGEGYQYSWKLYPAGQGRQCAC
jgi:hypothetical protein